MTNVRGIAAEIAMLALQVVGVAALGSAVIVYTWDSTRCPGRTLLVAVICTSLVRMAHSRYRLRRALKRSKRHTLPAYIKYPGSTDI